MLGQEVEESERLRVAILTGEAQTREDYIRRVVEGLPEGILALDAEGRVTAWNLAMEARCRLPAAAVLGRPLFECGPSYRTEPLAEPLGRLLRGKIPTFDLEAMDHVTAHGERVVLNLKGSLLRQHGRPAGAVLLVQDITERVALERSARQAEKLAALGTLAAGLAHELNNSIGIISSRVEIMLLEAESQVLPPAVMDDLRPLHRHAQRVARIAQGLLSFPRQSPSERGPVDLNHLVEETLLLVERQMGKDGIVVKRSLARDLPPVHGDANALQQVLFNLITNARDVLASGGEISVETAPAPAAAAAARLIVRDTGPGMPAEVLHRISDPFFTTKPAGTGLGLSITYGIVRDHQGTIDAQSRPGEGTTFTVTLPAAIGSRTG